MATDADRERVAQAIFEFLSNRNVADSLYYNWEDAPPAVQATFMQLVREWVMN